MYKEQIYVEPSVALPVNLLPYGFAGDPSWGSGLQELNDYCTRVGVRNAEIHPSKIIIQEVNDHLDPDKPDYPVETIGSIHKTFNTGTGLLGRLLERKGILRSQESFSMVGAVPMLQAVGRRVPAIHYLHKGGGSLPSSFNGVMAPNYPGAFNIVQPSAELLDEFGLSGDTDELLEAVHPYGIIGLCPDTLWSKANAFNGAKVPKDFADTEWDKQFASGHVYEEHVSLGRLDVLSYSRKAAIDSMKDFYAFTSTKWQKAFNTKTAEMVGRSIEHWKPPKDLVESAGKPILRLVIETLPGINEYQMTRIVSNLAYIAMEYGAIPLVDRTAN